MGKDQIIYGNCWIAYFDILGFKKLVNSNRRNIDSFAQTIYDEVLEEIINRSDRITEALNKKVNYAWFSDTFILFTEDDTYASYSSLDIVLWEVFQKMISKRHPLRGALSVGEFYANKNRSTYIGQALIDAYIYAEKQQWIGLILTPETRKKLSEPGYTLDSTRYSEYPVPIKPEKDEKLFARNICNLKKNVVQMQQAAENEKEYEVRLKVKYDNTLKFIGHLRAKSQDV